MKNAFGRPMRYPFLAKIVITNDDLECVYRIDTLELRDGEYVRDVDEALEWAAANREELYGRWPAAADALYFT